VIDLPTFPQPNGVDVALIDYGAVLTPALGGPVQKVNRMGSRFRVTISLPPMLSDITGRQWVGRLAQAKFDGARIAYPLLSFSPGTTGTVLVSGSGQAGNSLNVKGATAGYQFKEGQPFSIVTGGKHHLYLVATDTTASGTGTATIPIRPMLRRPHLDNDVCNFAAPKIEGLISGDEINWSMSVEKLISLQFDITEMQ
jgi:hypothetical protein